MDRAEALVLLGLTADDDLDTARRAYRRRIAEAHPDVAGPDANALAARLNLAWSLLRDGTAEPPPVPVPATPPPVVPEREPPDEETRVLLLDAVGPDAFALLEDAAAQVGYVSYIDRHLHLLEIVVRFEGGPSCSVVMTMQGRAEATEVFVSMASIEAAPTPPIEPVLAAMEAAIVGIPHSEGPTHEN